MGSLLIIDEIQAGLGRTGRTWGFEHAGITPDVVCVAKGIANGLPLGAIVARRDLMERWGPGAHASTFGGNAVACAAGVAVLKTIRREGLVANAATRGEQLIAAIREATANDSRVGDVRGRGLMIGVEFVQAGTGKRPDGERAVRVLERCLDLGLVLLTCGIDRQVLRWIPPLDVSADEVVAAAEIFRRALGEAVS
jgi:4-aminobutyrate aminotransferase